MSAVLYLIGAPGVGKTTAARAILDEAAKGAPFVLSEKPKWTRAGGDGDVYAAGHYTGAMFDGADTVGYSQAAEALRWWRDHISSVARLTILDGDRFSSVNSLAFLKECNATIIGAHLVGSDVAGERRRARGSAQNDAWIRGRVTKARNFAATIGATDIDATLDKASVVERIKALLP